ncbi:hypothetical protein [Psychrobacillus vulpis]|uniref:Uncharacterized protein n=1 Tax=Psychrobacillus vulpis TaxID=2325572 RepID=A0A544TKR9_9BACI|nr:hypothetical protein [Psychrobacillus vulpis]TQR18038.1 hypothetical protein FG384_16855 [Psychrobacillus vulpis]
MKENPLEDIRYTKEIDFVIKGGNIYTQEQLIEQVPSVEVLMKNIQAFIDSFEDTTIQLMSKNKGFQNI